MLLSCIPSCEPINASIRKAIKQRLLVMRSSSISLVCTLLGKPFSPMTFRVDDAFMNGKNIWSTLSALPVAASATSPHVNLATLSSASHPSHPQLFDPSSICLEVDLNLSHPVQLSRYTTTQVALPSQHTTALRWPWQSRKAEPTLTRTIFYPSKTKLSLHAMWWVSCPSSTCLSK